jgi:hypothetical protein
VWYRLVVPILLLAAGCGRKSLSTTADATIAPPAAEAGGTVLPPDAAPQPEVADAAGEAAAAAERSCEVQWLVAPVPGRTLLGGALAGHVAALLYGSGDGFVLLLVAGDPPEQLAVQLPGWPDPDGACGASPVGAVASYGDRFLVAYGPGGPERLRLRLRAVGAAKGALLPVNAPGAPGSDGAPVLELPLPVPEARPELVLHGYPRLVLLAAAFPGVEPSTGAVVQLTPTGAPAAADAAEWRLAGPSPVALLGPWRLAAPGGPDFARYVGPLGRAAVGVGDAGRPVRLPATAGSAEFDFADGWVPEPGAAVWFGPERLARGEVRVGGGAGVVVYDPRGAVAARLVLPAGTRPLAVSRDASELLVLGPGDEPGLCMAGLPPRIPPRLEPGGVLAHPTTGAGRCGR